jgi:hypothetical protein
MIEFPGDYFSKEENLNTTLEKACIADTDIIVCESNSKGRSRNGNNWIFTNDDVPLEG